MRRLAAALALALAALAPLAVGAGGPPALARDTWYVDVPEWHWAHPYIRVLYEEDVTDGWGPPLYSRSWYFPEREIARAEYTLMMARAFRLEPDPRPEAFFEDVPPTLSLYGRIPARPWIEAARKAGIVQGTPDRRFHPLDGTRRDASVAILVRALGLGPVAAGLSRQEADAYLRPFRDASQVDPSLYDEMALAVKLGIVVGYPDGTLRPRNALKRSEAAALVARSALFLLDAAPNPFSPDGDGIEDTTALRTRTLRNRNVSGWSVFIGTLSGQVFAAMGSPWGGAPPAVLTWDGRDQAGRPLAPGTYYYWGWVADRNGRRFWAVKKPIVLERLALSGTVHPAEVPPGGTLTVRAWTLGGARSVTALWPDGAATPLEPAWDPSGDDNDWSASRRLPEGTPEGTHALRLVARYRATERSLVLSYRVVAPLVLEARVTPNPAYRGHAVTAEARAAPDAEAVTVRWPWGATAELSRADAAGRLWRGRAVLPADLPPGRYPVTFTGRRHGRTASTTVALEVRADPLEEVQFVLTD